MLLCCSHSIFAGHISITLVISPFSAHIFYYFSFCPYCSCSTYIYIYIYTHTHPFLSFFISIPLLSWFCPGNPIKVQSWLILDNLQKVCCGNPNFWQGSVMLGVLLMSWWCFCGVLAVFLGVVASWYCWNGIYFWWNWLACQYQIGVKPLLLGLYADFISMYCNFWCDFLLCISRISTSSLPSFTYASPASVPRCLGYALCHGACFNPVGELAMVLVVCPTIHHDLPRCQLAGRIHIFFSA